MDLGEPSLECPVERKILWARDILDRRKRALLGDEQVTQWLSTLEQAIHRSRQTMSEAGIADLCRTCEVQEGGSCCGAGIEKHFGSTLLLLNLLMGASIPQRRYDPLSCFFLSEKGCRLIARHVLCVNFLCDKITSRVPADKIACLREKEGIELNLHFFLQERIRKILAEPLP
jgi:hypothetical protein